MRSLTPPHHRRWTELDRLLDELLDLERTARSKRLATIEGADLELHTALLRLLDADRRGNSMLDREVCLSARSALAACFVALRQDAADIAGTDCPAAPGPRARERPKK